MERIISQDVGKSHYKADACVIWCFDDRFSGLFENFVKKQGFRHVDLIKVAGGAKGIASPENEAERDYLLGQVKKSIRLHNSPAVILMVHSDCGAYGGLKFSVKEEEFSFYLRELEKAEEAVKNYLYKNSLKAGIVRHFADFEGLAKV